MSFSYIKNSIPPITQRVALELLGGSWRLLGDHLRDLFAIGGGFGGFSWEALIDFDSVLTHQKHFPVSRRKSSRGDGGAEFLGGLWRLIGVTCGAWGGFGVPSARVGGSLGVPFESFGGPLGFLGGSLG